MRDSEIFNNFIKIAQEKGMISPDAPEKAKKILESNPRMDSLNADAISKLYGLKPDAPKDMQYDKNIVENAHPNPVVVAPSYDKLNGLVENLNERQNILLNIVNKNNDGLLTQHKYAEQDLLLSLVSIANDLDNREQPELMTLADACLWQVSNEPIKKNARGWSPFYAAPTLMSRLVLNPVTGVAALVGVFYVQQHIDNFDQGFEQNHQRLISELDDFLNSNDNFGVGVKYKPEFIAMVQDFKNRLEGFYQLYQKALPAIKEVELPKTTEMSQEAIKMVSDTTAQAAIQSYNTLKAAAANLKPYLEQVVRNFNNESYKARQIEEKGFLTNLVDKTQFLHGGKGLVADDFDDVKHAIPPYLASVQEITNTLQTASQYQNSLQTQLQESQSQTDSLSPEQPAAPQDNKGMLASFDDKAGELAKEFGM
jgi:hypothetical protein